MTRTEKRLTDALDAAGRAIKDADLRPLPGPGERTRSSSRRWQRWLAPAAAAAAVLVIAGFVLIPAHGHGPQVTADRTAAPTVAVGADPTGIAVDTATATAYVSAGATNSLTLISTARCNATKSASAGCAVSSAATGGTDPIGVAVNQQTHTVYVANALSNTVAVINAQACNAAFSSGCAAKPALVKVGAGPDQLAVDQLTDTVYVTNGNSGTVSVIDGATCNASDDSGCGQTPATVAVGAGAFPIAVDAATDTVYAGVSVGVAVIDGGTCNAGTSSGCGQTPVIAPTGDEPAGLAVDDATETVYVSGESGNVVLLDRATCDAAGTFGCAPVDSVTVGSDPRGDELDAATSTLYVANAGSGTVSVLNTAACNVADIGGCKAGPAAFPVGSSPRRFAVDPANHALYVVNEGANSVSMIDSASCSATVTSGCPTAPAAGPSPSPVAAPAVTVCGPAETEQASGQPAAAFTAQAVRVASGSTGGSTWTLWARKGMSEPAALEDGGLVLGGRWYGLCTGFPNTAELELIDAGTRGIAYGYMAAPGKLAMTMTPAALRSPDIVSLGQISFFIASLAKSACAYDSVVLRADTPSGSAVHQLTFGTCQAGHDVAITGSGGEFGPGQSAASAPVPGSSPKPAPVAHTSLQPEQPG